MVQEVLTMTKKERAAEEAKKIIEHSRKIGFPMQKKDKKK